jgi:hypothetical protein
MSFFFVSIPYTVTRVGARPRLLIIIINSIHLHSFGVTQPLLTLTVYFWPGISQKKVILVDSLSLYQSANQSYLTPGRVMAKKCIYRYMV